MSGCKLLGPIQLFEFGRQFLSFGRRAIRGFAVDPIDAFSIKLDEIDAIVGRETGILEVGPHRKQLLKFRGRDGTGVEELLCQFTKLGGRDLGNVVLGDDSADRSKACRRRSGLGRLRSGRGGGRWGFRASRTRKNVGITLMQLLDSHGRTLPNKTAKNGRRFEREPHAREPLRCASGRFRNCVELFIPRTA